MTLNPSLKPGAWSCSGSIVCQESLGNLRILKSHTPSEAIVIERGDIEDLTVALDGILNEREAAPSDPSMDPTDEELRCIDGGRCKCGHLWVLHRYDGGLDACDLCRCRL